MRASGRQGLTGSARFRLIMKAFDRDGVTDELERLIRAMRRSPNAIFAMP